LKEKWCNVKEKMKWEGEFTLRSDPWAGLIASSGSFYPMVCRSWTILSWNYPHHSSMRWRGRPREQPMTMRQFHVRVFPEDTSTEKTTTSWESFGRLLGWWCTKGKGKVNRYLSIHRKEVRDRQERLTIGGPTSVSNSLSMGRL
jgi:hypothetical protein